MTLLYTDGSCVAGRYGGWGWITDDGRKGSGSVVETTNQRMELLAALEGLSVVTDQNLTVVSDSRYLVDCFLLRWYVGWLERDWRTYRGKPIANRDIWEPLIHLALDRNARFRWVKSHSTDRLNTAADWLAWSAAQALYRGTAYELD